MRIFITVIILIQLGLNQYRLNAQSFVNEYVILNNNGDFELGSQPFYPIVMNYGIMLKDIGAPVFEQYYPAPTPGYANQCVGSTACYNQMVINFEMMIDQGFNAVRLGLGVYRKNALPSSNTHGIGSPSNPAGEIVLQHYFSKDTTDPFGTKLWYLKQFDVIQPYTNFLDQINTVVSAVKDASTNRNKPLKIILLTGARYCDGFGIRDEYANYLAACAEYFKDEKAIMAYDYFNEPLFSNHAYHRKHSKEDICYLTNYWYQAIKTESPNHLVTFGSKGHMDVFEWDPAITKVDFHSFHFYPLRDTFPNGLESFQAKIKWVSDNIEQPWIIGETGYSASQYAGGCHFETNTKRKVDGTLSDQANFADMSLDYVRDCGGKGYSWWEFSDTWSGDDYYGLNEKILDNLSCYPNSYTYHQAKLAANEFHPNNFNPYQVNPNGCTLPSNYLFFEHVHSLPIKLYGYVYDMNGNPIKDAVIGIYMPSGKYFQTLSAGDGFYHLEALLQGNYDIRCSAPGRILIDNGVSVNLNFGINYRDFYLSNQSDTNIVKSLTIPANVTIIPEHSPKKVTYDDLKAEVGSVGSISATKQITLDKGSYMRSSSNIRLFIKPYSCSDGLNGIGSNYRKPRTEQEEKQIAENEISIFPNPSNGLFQIKGGNSVSNYTVLDASGMVISKNQLLVNEIDLTSLPSGIYFVKFTMQDGQIVVDKIMKQ